LTHNRARLRFTIKKTLAITGVGSLLFLLSLAFLLSPRYSPSSEALSFVKDAIARQEKIEEDLRAYYQSGKFTFTDPLVIQDPYHSAPLTALLIFDTPEDSRISIHVPGKTPQTAVDFTFTGYQQHHEIPIYGLYPAMLNRVTVSMETQTGESAQTEVDLRTEPIPVYIQDFLVDKLESDRYSPGYNFTFLDRKPVFDMNGTVRWYSTHRSWEVFTPLKNGRFLFTYTEGDTEGNLILEQDLLGKIYAIYNIADGIHHDIYELPSGNLLITSADLRSGTIEDYVIEVDRSTGHIVRSFDLKDYLDPGRPHQVEELAANDWLHLNSIVYDPADQTIIISSKAQSAVIKMTYPGMQVKWILGPHDNWSPKFQPYLLTPVGDNFEWSWSQHHATLYGSDNSGDTSIDILLFDNGLYRSFDSASAYSPDEWYSRVVHYRIDEASMTIEQAWEYGKENGAATFSALRGSAYLLSNGNILGTWGDIYKDALGNPLVKSTSTGTEETKIIEVDPPNNDIIFECSIPGAETYRTFRAGLYDGYSEANAYLSTPLINTTGNDLLDRGGMAWRDVKRWTITPLLSWLKTIYHQVLPAIK
jgi:arylsulfate sulfotransferase